MTDEQITACKLTDFEIMRFEVFCALSAERVAQEVYEDDGSLGATREAAIAAFTRGYDEKAAELLEGK